MLIQLDEGLDGDFCLESLNAGLSAHFSLPLMGGVPWFVAKYKDSILALSTFWDKKGKKKQTELGFLSLSKKVFCWLFR